MHSTTPFHLQENMETFMYPRTACYFQEDLSTISLLPGCHLLLVTPPALPLT